MTVCYAESEEEARRKAYQWWPIAVVCGPDPNSYVAQIETYADAGFDHVYLHQVGPDQEGFFRFAQEEILPRFARRATAAR